MYAKKELILLLGCNQRTKVEHQVSKSDLTQFFIAYEEGGKIKLDAIENELIGPPLPGIDSFERSFLKR